ncbi:1-phosphofructokinase family hexose kinase [Brevibacterium casei]|uniref:1-phosphofructokinase family hexose kinase n=1 Tax=Brevibacterium casei TaxID=33889 RepID=UPI001E3FE99C|nr:PfkB family carbohydrate kinase [Brevibacterium casei]
MTADSSLPDGAAPAVAVLTLSPALDCTLTVPRLDRGRTHRAAPAAEVLGGKGVNVARVLAALGVPSVAVGPVGAKHWPAADDEESVRWELTDTPAPLRRSIAVIEDSGRATLINETAHPHPAHVWAELRAGLAARLRAPGLRVLVISGSTPDDCPADLVPGLIAAAHAAGVTVIVDTSGAGLLTAAEAGADWVKPNDEELRALFADEADTERAKCTAAIEQASSPGTALAGARLSDTAVAVSACGDPVLRGAGRLIDAGARHVLVSRGADGMDLVDATGPRRRARLARTLHGNPTGAGDAAVAALAWTLASRAAGVGGDAGGGADAEAGGDAGGGAETGGDDGAGAGAGDGSARESAGDHLGAAEIGVLLTRAVAVSAAAVLMPQAGQIHARWRDFGHQVITEDIPAPATTPTSHTDGARP